MVSNLNRISKLTFLSCWEVYFPLYISQGVIRCGYIPHLNSPD